MKIQRESRLEVLGNGMCHLLHAGKTTELDFASLEGWPSSRFRTPLVSGAWGAADELKMLMIQ